MKKFVLCTLLTTVAFLPGTGAYAAQFTVAQTDGITIDSNNDSFGGEYFEVNDGGDTILHAVGGSQTTLQNDGNVTIDYDQNNDGSGTFSINSGGTPALSIDNAGVTTIHGAATTNGITNTGAIATDTMSTTGAATLNSASITTTLGVTGATTTNGITNTGAIGTDTLSTTGAASLNSASIATTLAVTGATTTTGLTNTGALATTTLSVSGASVTHGINNSSNGITNAGSIAGVTTISASGNITTSSGAITATNGNITATNGSVRAGTSVSLRGGTAGLNVNTTSGQAVMTSNVAGGNNVATTSLTNTGAAVTFADATGDVHGLTVGATGTTLTGGTGAAAPSLSLNDTGATIQSANNNRTVAVTDTGTTISSGTGNTITVGDTQTATVGSDTISYGTRVDGGMLVNGDLGVNGNIYSLNTTANASVSIGNNGLAIVGSENKTTLTADSNASSSDGRGQLTLEETQASLLVNNATNGNAHGLVIEQDQTVLSGGTTSTTLTLNDNGATFANTDTGGPARVRGVADGHDDYDAANMRQLRKSYAGIAAVSALTNIPPPAQGKRFNMGLGYGNFEEENAVAFGGHARLSERISLKAGFGHSSDANTFGAGIGYSW